MQPQIMQEITPQTLAQNMGGIKRRISQTAGETQQMTADVMSQSLEQVMQMCNNIFNQISAKNAEINKITEKLEKCYNAHPELKVAEDASEKEAKEKASRGKAKKV